MTGPVLHVDFVSLRGGVSGNQRAGLVAAARPLAEIDGVSFAGVIDAMAGSDADLVLYFLFERFEDLEPFGTDVRYVQFLQKDLAPAIQGISGADVLLDTAFSPGRNTGVCLALAAPEETYDWEVKADLAGWLVALGGEPSVIGLAVGERQRYRGVALTFVDGLSRPLPPAPLGYGAMITAGATATLR